MSTPLQRAALSVSPELLLTVAVGDEKFEVSLDTHLAYGLVHALLASIAGLRPWHEHDEAHAIERIHDLGFTASRLAASALRMSFPADTPGVGALVPIIENPLAAIEFLNATLVPHDIKTTGRAH